MSTTANIASKGTKSTGLTEQIAQTLHDTLGKTVVAIVEITSEARTEKKNGDEQVKLALGMIEIAPNGMTEDHLRELARSFHYERQLADGQPTLDGDDIEPKVNDVLAAGQQFRPHPYLASTLSTEDEPVCDVCGQLEGAVVHAERTGMDDPFAVPDPDDEDMVDDPDAETCPAPGCDLVAEHDGDHDPEPDGPAAA